MDGRIVADAGLTAEDRDAVNMVAAQERPPQACSGYNPRSAGLRRALPGDNR